MNIVRLIAVLAAFVVAAVPGIGAAERGQDGGDRQFGRSHSDGGANRHRDSGSGRDAGRSQRNPSPPPSRSGDHLRRTPPPAGPTLERRTLHKEPSRAVPAPRAQPPDRRTTREPERRSPNRPPERRDIRLTPPRAVPGPPLKPPAPGFVLDKRHAHNHYYPRVGHIEKSLPSGHRRVPYHNTTYHFHNGVWYRHSTGSYIVVRPPIGLTLSFLPPFYSVIWVGAVPYYYAAGVYYVWYPEYQYYRVVAAPSDSDIRDEPPGTSDLFIYPREGQSAEQQAQDRFDCHQWAVEQTGFDPTEPGGNVQSSRYASARADYRRAIKACLEGRGYSVQ